MKYRLTILNVAAVLLLMVDNYIYWSSYVKGEVAAYGLTALVLSVAMGIHSNSQEMGVHRIRHVRFGT